jgi:hypothetical protein
VQEKKGRYFLADKKGKEALALDAYTEVRYLPRGGKIDNPPALLLAENGQKKKGVIDFDGKEIIPFRYTHLQMESDSIIVAYDGNKVGYISVTGEVILPPQPDTPVSHFEDGIVQMRKEKAYVEYFMDRTGKTIVEPY